jgi:hypothetical protein
MDENTLVIHHQDGELAYWLEQGGYNLKSGHIRISVRTKAVGDDQFPDCALFCVDDHPVSLPLSVGDVFEANSDWLETDADGPCAYAYFTFHAEDVSVKWTAKEVAESNVLFALEARHDDINYYGDRAKPTLTEGLFRLEPKSPAELWSPN